MRDATVAVLLFEGFEELDALGPYDVLSTALGEGASLSAVEQVTVDGAERVTASEGTTVVPHGRLDPADPPAYLVVPGGRWSAGGDTGARAAAASDAVLSVLRDCHAPGTTVASVCTGAMILERAGLLDGRPATTHHTALDDLASTDARLVDARVVDDGDVLTAGGVTAGLDLALWLVEREWGDDTATAVAAALEYERSTDIYHSGDER